MPDVRERLDRMKDKEMCTIAIKPDINVGIFWLQTPDRLRSNKWKLDLSPQETSRKAKITKMPPKGHVLRPNGGNYIGICIRLL